MLNLLGTCLVCQQLVRIYPGDFKRGTQNRWYWPAEHVATDGLPCIGARRPL